MKGGMKKRLAQTCQQAGCEILCGKDGLYHVSNLNRGISCRRKEEFFMRIQEQRYSEEKGFRKISLDCFLDFLKATVLHR